MKIYLLHRLELPKHKNLWWHGEPSNYQKLVLRNAVQLLRSSKKSFLRERSVSFLLKSRSEGNAELTAKNKR
jgi:late competence protein required for DNA uptake (superfamily II DNA/RNA helicase)